jgi:hypothetical protein
MANYIKNIFINSKTNFNINKAISANVLIPSVTNFSHEQCLVTTNWSLPNDQDSADFAIADETEEFVSPESTDFDYSQDYNEDSADFAISEESEEFVSPQSTTFDYSQEDNGDPTDVAITEPMES